MTNKDWTYILSLYVPLTFTSLCKYKNYEKLECLSSEPGSFCIVYVKVEVMAAQVILTVASWSGQTMPMLGLVKPETCFCHRHSV